MNRQFLLLSLTLCFYSCGNKNIEKRIKSFDEFIFSQSALHENYSLKFTKSDTLFLEERFPEPSKQFYAFVSDSIRRKLNFILDTLNIARFDTAYLQENLQDGVSYKFYLRNDSFTKTVGVYGYEVPKELYSFSLLLDSFAKTVIRYPIVREIDFGDLSGINPPPAPPPPKMEH